MEYSASCVSHQTVNSVRDYGTDKEASRMFRTLDHPFARARTKRAGRVVVPPAPRRQARNKAARELIAAGIAVTVLRNSAIVIDEPRSSLRSTAPARTRPSRTLAIIGGRTARPSSIVAPNRNREKGNRRRRHPAGSTPSSESLCLSRELARSAAVQVGRLPTPLTTHRLHVFAISIRVVATWKPTLPF